MADFVLVRRMNRFRNVGILVAATFATTYGALVFIFYRKGLAEQIHPTTEYPAKFPPEFAWISAAVVILYISLVIAVTLIIVMSVSALWQFFRSGKANR